MTHPEQGHVRATDRDRDQAVQRLGDALAEGALDAAEYGRRLDRALAAGTHGDLARLTGDLPPSQAARKRAEAAKAEDDRRAWKSEWGHWAGGALIMTVIWAVSALRNGEWGFYWPVMPLGIWAAVLVSNAIRPSDD